MSELLVCRLPRLVLSHSSRMPSPLQAAGEFKKIKKGKQVMDTDRIKKSKELLQFSHVKEDPMNIKNIKSPSERVQLYAVAHDCHAFEHIKNPTDRVRKTAMLCANADYIRKTRPPETNCSKCCRQTASCSKGLMTLMKRCS